MLIDTHCHINNMTKKTFDILLIPEDFQSAKNIIDDAVDHDVKKIINVGTSLIESKNCVALARKFPEVYATIGIHPNDLTTTWQQDLQELEKLIEEKENKIVGIGECGLDFHYPEYNLELQKTAFRAQIELALKYNLALVVHTRDAAQETLQILEEYKDCDVPCVIHCFSEQEYFAQQVIDWGFLLGIGGIITYPKNNYLRDIVKKFGIENIILETDAPFLPPQIMRGKQNSPATIKIIAEYIAVLTGESLESVANQTTNNAVSLFNLQ